MGEIKNDIVEVTCYGETEQMIRQDAITKFLEGIMCSEGHERQRYVRIYNDLISGKIKCRDEEEF